VPFVPYHLSNEGVRQFMRVLFKIISSSNQQLKLAGFLPIIMLTIESDESKKREGQAAGARAWVVKPFKPEQMLGAVQRLCLP
jgi:CheY-like chemotaxis protein